MLACGGVMFRAARNGRSVAHAARAMIAADNAQVRAAPPASRSGRAADSVARNPAVWTRPDPREIAAYVRFATVTVQVGTEVFLDEFRERGDAAQRRLQVVRCGIGERLQIGVRASDCAGVPAHIFIMMS